MREQLNHDIVNEENTKYFHQNEIKEKYEQKIVWRNVIAMILLHMGAFYGFYLGLNPNVHWTTIFGVDLIGRFSGMGVLAGSHRLWAHRSYKAKLPLRIFLMILQTMALQNDIYEWCRDHRTHHKFSETDADPHNSRRGFFFAHMGWLLVKKHPDVIKKGKTIDLSDVWADPVVRFQRRFYIPLVVILWGIVPTYFLSSVFGVKPLHAFFGAVLFRYVYTLHSAWLVNSAAHLYGNQPYDHQIIPKENRFVSYQTMGEGYHNYHHAFPWDYSASEFGWRNNFNPATAFIDVCAFMGLAYDLKKPDPNVVQNRIKRSGDGTYFESRINFYIDLMEGLIINNITTCVVILSRIIVNGHI